MAKNEKKTNRQTIVHMTKHRKLKKKQHEPLQKIAVISGASEGWADSAPYVAPVVLLPQLRNIYVGLRGHFSEVE